MALARCMSLRWPDVSLSTNGKEIHRTVREENEIRVLSIVDAPRRFLRLLPALKYLNRNLPYAWRMALARCMSLRWPDVSLSTKEKKIHRTVREEKKIRVLAPSLCAGVFEGSCQL